MSNQIPRFKTHICFVSEQPMPNLLLCFDQNTKPENVILLTSSRMAKEGTYDTLEQSFKKLGIKVKKEILPDISLFSLQRVIEDFINALPDEAMTEFAFNITCGTKLMTMAAVSACNQCIEMFYVDTSNSKLFLLKEKKEYALSNFCTVQTILNSYGFRITKRTQTKREHGKITQTLLNQRIGMIKILNMLSAQAKESNVSKIEKMTPELDRLLVECEEAKLLERQGDTLIFADEDSRSFCNGIWLEEYVYQTLAQLKLNKQIADYEGAVNIIYADRVVSNAEAKPDNELDALFVRENILYLVECKTCRMNDDKKARDIMYKLDSLHDKIGGVFGRGILISLEPLSENERKHAQKNNLIVIDDIQKIKNLRKALIEIFENEKRKK